MLTFSRYNNKTNIEKDPIVNKQANKNIYFIFQDRSRFSHTFLKPHQFSPNRLVTIKPCTCYLTDSGNVILTQYFKTEKVQYFRYYGFPIYSPFRFEWTNIWSKTYFEVVLRWINIYNFNLIINFNHLSSKNNYLYLALSLLCH
jgi:hypothetical protein